MRAQVSVLLILLCLPFAAAAGFPRSGHLVLLTVAEDEQPLAPQLGGTADLTLEIRPGTGRIFIDTYPWTKLDTQSSIRSANQVACTYLDTDCTQYDFFYTIRADSVIVGGPSAGAAIAVLTAALLEDAHINESVAITGTINSGGLIGPIAGLKAKALAAKARGLSLVLTSSFSQPTELNASYVALLNATNMTSENSSVNLSRLYVPVNLTGLGIEVREVGTLAEALAAFTGKAATSQNQAPLTEDPAYTVIMQDVASQLCTRRDALARQFPANLSDENATRLRDQAQHEKDWYSLASYCFSDLITLRGEEYAKLNQPELKLTYGQLLSQLSSFETNLDARNLTTLAQLETYMIVKERLDEAKDTLTGENATNLSAADLGFAAERLHSADVWSAFFLMRSEPLSLRADRLAAACEAKRVEAEERINYAELYLPVKYLADAQQELDAASSYEEEGRYPVCLYRAAKAEAQADLLTGSLSVPQEKLDALLGQKLAAVADVIRRQEARGHFPILGYSYYRYSQSLRQHDPYSALTFAEYSLELSNLDLYFPPEPRSPSRSSVDPYLILLFVSGLILGVVVGVGFAAVMKRRRRVGAPGKRRTAGVRTTKKKRT